MKIKIILLFLLISSTMLSQWKEQYFTNVKRTTLRSITSTDIFHLWAVGDTGVVIYSTDKGRNWTTQNSGVLNNLFAIQFIDSLQGWIVGAKSTLLTTSNGGVTWASQEFITPGLQLQSLCFSDRSNGWITAQNPGNIAQSMLFRTYDSGLNWQQVILPANITGPLFKVQFLDTLHGWMFSGRNLFYTTNGGNNWDVFNNNGDIYSSFCDFQFLNNNRGFCLIDRSFKFYTGRTTNGGVAWTVDSAIAKSFNGIDARLHFIDTLIGSIIGGDFIAVTKDGGMKWNVTSRTGLLGLRSVRVVDKQNIYAMGNNSTYSYSTDCGMTWTNQIPPPTPVNLRMVKYQTETLLWAVGGTCTLLQSTNGGEVWRQIGIPTGMNINGMSFPDPFHSYILDDSARIFKSIDSGITWSQQLTGLKNGLKGIYFIDSLFGCTVGISGSTLITTNGGSDWNKITNASSCTLNDVIFINRNAGWAVGDSGTIVRAYDSGKLWTIQSCPTNAALRSISFSDTLNGIIIGDSGVVMQTTDGGAAWILHPTENGLTFRGIKMLGSIIWMVGDSGQIRSSSDFGLNWNIQNSGTTTTLYGVDFITHQIGLAVGDNMTVLITQNGGRTTYVEDHKNVLNVDSYRLYNNFPNPFNPGTTINFRILKAGHVTLKVFNILGQEIVTLLDTYKTPQMYRINFDGKGLSSGVYLYKLTAPGFTQVKKMVFIK